MLPIVTRRICLVFVAGEKKQFSLMNIQWLNTLGENKGAMRRHAMVKLDILNIKPCPKASFPRAICSNYYKHAISKR